MCVEYTFMNSLCKVNAKAKLCLKRASTSDINEGFYIVIRKLLHSLLKLWLEPKSLFQNLVED
jgi:hypothetical protein